jgi:hypothetical protein
VPLGFEPPHLSFLLSGWLMGDGNNVAIFYPQYVSYDETYRQVVNVCSLSYEFEDTPLIDEDGLYKEDL